MSLCGTLSASACGAKSGLPVVAVDRCVRLDAVAERTELDVLVMLDTSTSMAFETADGERKALAVRNALAQFFEDPDSAGMGVALSFFPILRPEVPTYCVGDDECGEPGACYLWPKPWKLCLPSGERECTVTADCAGTSIPNDTCVELGGCANDALTLCLPEYDASLYCSPGIECKRLGGCTNGTVCDPEAYSTPVVDVVTLPGARTELLLALDTHESEGSTPTLPALTGALSAARARQDARPGHKAIVLLATDGFPTSCDDDIDPELIETSTQGIDKLVAVAEPAARDGVQTFVIGVFAPEEEELAQANLGRIAVAGSTGEAFIVTTDQQVSERLVSALDAIRKSARACEFAIPWPTSGGHDPDTLAVHLKDSSTGTGGAAVTRVSGAAECDPLDGGFYFDREPAPGALPRRVILCEASCSRVATGSGSVEVLADCASS